MPQTESFNVFIWEKPDKSLIEEVLAYIKGRLPLERKVVILHSGDVFDVEDSIPLLFYIYIKCQQFKVFDNEKRMFLNPKEFTQAAELCLEKLKLLQNGAEESVIHCHEAYKKGLQETNKSSSMHKLAFNLKEFVNQNNCIDIWQMLCSFQKYQTTNHEFFKHVLEIKFLILGAIDMHIFKEIMSFFNCKTVLSIVIETPLNINLQGSPSTQSSTITTESIEVDGFRSDVEKPSSLESATDEYCKEIMTAFLSLLINSRNELALSKVMISPFINLSHEAFTHLKHLAVEKEMPMCQTAISYVTRVRLGGKGYAPPQNCPMQPHLKCLELFVDTLNHLQTIMEEDLSPKSSITRLINVLKKRLLKCDSDKLKRGAVEKASAKLRCVADRVLVFAESQQCNNSSVSQICQETLDVLHYLVNYMNCLCWTFDPEKILIQRQCKRTPLNLPPLLGYFRSPEEESTCEENPIIDEDSIVSNSSTLWYPPPLMSYFHNSDNSCSATSAVPICITPTKTNFKDCIKKKESVEENDVFDNSKAERFPANNLKRPALSDVANIDIKSEKKIKTAEGTGKLPIKVKESCSRKGLKKVVKKTNLSKKFKLIEGQGKITTFFSISQK